MEIIKQVDTEVIIHEVFTFTCGFNKTEEYLIMYLNMYNSGIVDFSRCIGTAKYISSSKKGFLHKFEFKLLLNLPTSFIVKLLLKDINQWSIDIAYNTKLLSFNLNSSNSGNKKELFKGFLNELIE